MNSHYIDIPEEAKSELQLSSMVSSFYMDASDYHQPFMDNLVESFGFYDGSRQWIEKDPITGKYVDVKARLNSEGKPALTKNFIFPIINLIQGVHINERFMAKVLPRTDEDGLYADGMGECMTYLWDDMKGDRKLGNVFQNGNICGRGWLGIEQVEDDNDIFQTKTALSVVDSSEILYDRKSKEYDLSDCDYLIRERLIPRALALMLWPQRESELRAYYGYLSTLINPSRFSESRYSSLQKDIAILECWYRVYEKKKFLLDSVSGRVRDVSKIPDDQIRAILYQYPELDVIQKKARVMKYVHMVGNAINGVVLDSGLSPYDDNFYPYVPYFAYRSRDLDFGIVENAKDAQVEVNKRDSQILHYINEMNRTRLITDDPGLGDSFEDGDPVIVHKVGSTYKIIEPAKFPVALGSMVERNKDDVKRITGISDDLRGMKSGQDSGVVVDMRRQQAMNNIAMLFDNLSGTQEIAARIMMSRIRQFMTPAQIARILGPKKAFPMVIQGIKDKAVHEYDLSITQNPSSPTLRAENFEKIVKLNEMLGGQLPPEVIIEASDIAQKDELLGRLPDNAGDMNTNEQNQPQGSRNAPAVKR